VAVLEQLRAARRDPGLAVLEGFPALQHALRFGADVVLAATDDAPLAARLATELAPDLGLDRLLRPLEPGALGPGAHHTRVVAVARRPAFAAPPPGTGPVVALEDPRHPGNVGAVVRVAAAAGAAGVVTTGDRDPWDPAALRGSAGLHFALPVGRVPALPEDRPLVAVVPGAEPPRTALAPDALLAFGTERAGLSPALAARADDLIGIPMRPGVSSLNLATAVAVVLYAFASTDRSGFSQRSIVQTGDMPTDS
jgi:RNA methyltransferase, TrmH family